VAQTWNGEGDASMNSHKPWAVAAMRKSCHPTLN
jgi:hypothetical protein